MTADQGFAQSIEDFLNNDMSVAERRLEAIIAGEARPREKTYWMDELDGCNACGHPFASLRYMVDAIFRGGVGANLCARCFLEQGRGLGTGYGQAYESTKEGWLKVAG